MAALPSAPASAPAPIINIINSDKKLLASFTEMFFPVKHYYGMP